MRWVVGAAVHGRCGGFARLVIALVWRWYGAGMALVGALDSQATTTNQRLVLDIADSTIKHLRRCLMLYADLLIQEHASCLPRNILPFGNHAAETWRPPLCAYPLRIRLLPEESACIMAHTTGLSIQLERVACTQKLACCALPRFPDDISLLIFMDILVCSTSR